MNDPKSKDQQEWEQDLFDMRINEQQAKNDYNEDMESCQQCGGLLNSHDHCPRCDY